MHLEFKEFPKLSRLSREVHITEKLDGTNASIFIQNEVLEDKSFGKDPNILATINGLTIRAGSRTKWIIPRDDNYGFANWVLSNAEELLGLGEGHHFGEWWGSGIQRGYGLPKGEKRFSLFNTTRWKVDSFEEKGFQAPPKICGIVPLLYVGMFDTQIANDMINTLLENGSAAVPGYKNPEGIVVFHTAANVAFKKTCHKDELHKSQIK